MRKLVVVTNLPNPYRVPLFNHLAPRLRAAGWELSVVFGSRTNARRRWRVDERGFGFPHHFLGAKNVQLAPDRVFNTYRGLTRHLNAVEPDALVCTGFTPGTMMAGRYARRHGVPWAIWSGAVAGREPGLLRRLQRRWLVRRCPAFLAYGSAAQDYLVSLGAPPERVHIAWNTVDTSRFLSLRGARTPHRREPLRLLSVGYLEKGKRIDLLLRAVGAALERGLALTLDIVGEGSERAALEEQAHPLGDAVRFAGHKDYGDLGPCFERAHAFAFPTQYDVWGLALLEAMAAGLPALASTRAGATRDLVVDGETGFAVDFEDTDAAVDRLERLVRGDLAHMGRAARDRVRSRFTLDASAAGWLELLSTW